LKKGGHSRSWSISLSFGSDLVFTGLARQTRLVGLDGARIAARNQEKDKLLSTPSALQAKDLEGEIKASRERARVSLNYMDNWPKHRFAESVFDTPSESPYAFCEVLRPIGLS
jgi:hypothetical protein